MTIELTPELQQALDAAARQHGTTPETLALSIIREGLFARRPEAVPGAAPRNLAERLSGFIGVLDSGETHPGGAQMSTRTGEQFTDILANRREQGRL